jgi:hypothetical protein
MGLIGAAEPTSQVWAACIAHAGASLTPAIVPGPREAETKASDLRPLPPLPLPDGWPEDPELDPPSEVLLSMTEVPEPEVIARPARAANKA